MSGVNDPNPVKVTEIFLIPSSFFVAALGTADSNIPRARPSLPGLGGRGLWVLCSREAWTEGRATADAVAHPRRMKILVWLPVVFAVGWLISTVIHAVLWNQPLGNKS